MKGGGVVNISGGGEGVVGGGRTAPVAVTFERPLVCLLRGFK